MAVREILEIGHPVLAARAQEVPENEIGSGQVQGWVDDLIDTMRAANGAGIAANQIGIPYRLFSVEVRPNNPRYPYKPAIPLTVLINPTVKPITDETFDNYEGCLSVPNLRGVVARPVGVSVEAQDRHGELFKKEIWGLSAGTYQHECDHLDGRLFVDRVHDTRSLCTWEVFDKHYRTEFVKRAEALCARFPEQG